MGWASDLQRERLLPAASDHLPWLARVVLIPQRDAVALAMLGNHGCTSLL